MIEVRNLTKKYRDLVAVDNISFTVEKGDILGLLGPNGAGKTTTMRMLTGFLSPTSGETLINNRSVLDEPLKVKKSIGYLPETPPLYVDMIVKHYLRHVANLKGLAHRDINKEIDRVVALCGLEKVYSRLIRNLSKGFRQRVGIAQALLGSPEVLILDEPTVGLDPAQIREVRELIRDLAQEHTVILSTHILTEVTMICNRVVIINAGKIVASDTIENLNKRSSLYGQVRVELSKPNDKALSFLSAQKEVTTAKTLRTNEWFELDLQDTAIETRTSLLQKLAASEFEVSEFQNVSSSLEDIFLRIVSGEINSSDLQEKSASETQVKAKAKPTEVKVKVEAKPTEVKAEVKPVEVEVKPVEAVAEVKPAEVKAQSQGKKANKGSRKKKKKKRR